MAEFLTHIKTKKAPEPLGPYSQGVVLSAQATLIFVSGQIPIDSSTGKVMHGAIEKQAHTVFDQIEAILREKESGLNQVVKVEIFTINLRDFFPGINAVYEKRFSDCKVLPSRVSVEVSALPLGADLEVSCTAYKAV